MKPKRLSLLLFLVMILGISGITVYIFATDPAPTNRFRPISAHESAMDLLFLAHDGFGFDVYAESVGIYLAHYQQGQRVLHERVTSIATTEAFQFSGSLFWGITIQDNQPSELRATVSINGAQGRGYFDLSQIDLPQGVFHGSFFGTNDPIERGRQYPLRIWQSSGSFWHGADLQEKIDDNDEIVILYVLFE